MDLRRAKYILPNLFTLSSLGAGLYSIHLSTTAQSADQIALAAWILVVSLICDGFDGRVARMTRTETELGIQLDSLADAVAFGVAPAFLLYHWGMSEWGVLGLAVAFVFVACAILRLARFNVLAARAIEETKKYFIGLPTPLAAGTVIALVLAHVSFTETAATGAAGSVAAVTLFLAGLMVSNVRYRTFKDVDLRGRTWVVASMVVALSVGLSVVFKPSITLVVLMVAYIVLGLGGGLLSLGKTLFGTGEAEEPLLIEAGDGD
jgi:CDP-diacylglycerol---serine O-phosphatidyltransferase